MPVDLFLGRTISFPMSHVSDVLTSMELNLCTWQRGLVGPLPATVTLAVIPRPLYTWFLLMLLRLLPASLSSQPMSCDRYTEVISTNSGDIYHEVGIPAES